MKKILLSILLFLTILFMSCENMLNSTPTTNFSFNFTESNARFMQDLLLENEAFTDETIVDIACYLKKDNNIIEKRKDQITLGKLEDIIITFEKLEFSTYTIDFTVKYNGIELFEGNTTDIILTESENNKTVDIDIVPKVWTIKYNLNGGKLPSIYPQKYYVASNIKLPVVTKEGATFSHWETDKGQTVTQLGTTSLLGDVTLNAIWDTNYYTVKYITNTDTPKDDIKIPYGYSLTASELVNNLSKPEYDFDGWYVDGQKIDVGYKVTKDITLTAHWTKQGYTSSVTFTPNGGAIDLNDTVELSTTDVGATIYYAISPSTTYETYSNPIKIDKNKNTTITAYAKINGKLPSPETSKTFSIKTYTVKFDNANHGIKPNDITGLVRGSTLTSEQLKPLDEKFFDFLGWYVGDVKVDKSYVISSNITILAKWKEQVALPSVTFSITSGAVDINETVSLSCPNNSDASIYYTLDNSSPDPSDISSSSSTKLYDNTPITISKGMTIKAVAVKNGMKDSTISESKYTIKTYTVKFDNANHGTKPKDITGLVRGSTLTTEQLKPLDEKFFDFLGWYVGDVKVDESYVISSNITILAKWKEQATLPKVTFSVTNGAIDINETVSLSCPNNSDASIYYTLDNSTPTSSSTPYTTSITVSKDMTIKAIAVKNGMKDSPISESKYTIKTYNITFNNGGHGTAPSDIPNVNAAYKIPENKLTPLTEKGYTFKGYFDQHGSPVTTDYQIKENLTITAQWEVITYNITYNNCDEPQITNNNQKTYTVEDNITLTDPINKPGHRFLGWYNSTNFIDANKVTNIANKTGDITLYANWQPIDYTITYEPSNGEVINQKTLSYNSNLTPEYLPTISKPGHTFDGWYIDNQKVDETYQIKSNITLTAKWTIHTHTITYVTNTSESIPVKTVDYGYKLTASDLPTSLIKDQHDFNNWYINGSVANEGYVVTDNIILTAQWTKWTTTESVNFSNTTEVDYEENITLSCEIGSTIYYTLDKKDPLTSSTRQTVTPTSGSITTVNIPITQNTTIKAYSTRDHKLDSAVVEKTYTVKTYTVTFDSKGHGTAPEPIQLHKNEKIPEATLTQTTEPGYNLKGWFKDPGLTNQWISGTDQMQTSPITLYAKWELETYNISYQTETGTPITDTLDSNTIRHSNASFPTSYTIKDGTVTLYPPAKDGYLGKWHKDTSSGTVIDTITIDSSTLGGITLVASGPWTPITYKVQYDRNRGSGSIPEETVTYGTPHPLNDGTGFTRKGYAFGGWQTTREGGTIVTESYNDCTKQDDCITVYAKWNDITPPSDVTINNTSATQADKQVTLNWTNPTDSDFDHVEISYQDIHNTEALKTKNTSSKTESTVTITGLSNDTKYKFTLRAVDTSGNKATGVDISSFANALYSFNKQIKLLPSSYVSKLHPTSTPPYGGKWKYVEFGYWPQSLVSSDVTVEKATSHSWSNITLWRADDNNYYVRKNITPPASNSLLDNTFSNGSKANSGNEYCFKMEPIVWRVANEDYSYDESDPSKKGIILIAESILYGSNFATDGRKEYFVSNLYNYVNGAFFDSALGPVASNILTSTKDLTAYPPDIRPQELVVKVITPSKEQVMSPSLGFSDVDYNQSSRNIYVTDYAMAMGCYKYKQNQSTTPGGGVGAIYLRDRDPASDNVNIIDQTGAINTVTDLTQCLGILPMIVIPKGSY